MDVQIGIPCTHGVLCSIFSIFLSLFFIFLAIGIINAIVQKTRELKKPRTPRASEAYENTQSENEKPPLHLPPT